MAVAPGADAYGGSEAGKEDEELVRAGEEDEDDGAMSPERRLLGNTVETDETARDSGVVRGRIVVRDTRGGVPKAKCPPSLPSQGRGCPYLSHPHISSLSPVSAHPTASLSHTHTHTHTQCKEVGA